MKNTQKRIFDILNTALAKANQTEIFTHCVTPIIKNVDEKIAIIDWCGFTKMIHLETKTVFETKFF
tara:strand:- start:1771 stop:1968 length:198 start_codon:yes stop_codon:yes gene_type:complete